MASIDTELLIDIINHGNSQINPRIAEVYCEMVEDLKILKDSIEKKGRQSPALQPILKNIRGKYHEIYKTRIPLNSLPETISYNNKTYKIRDITKEFFDDILKLEEELEKK